MYYTQEEGLTRDAKRTELEGAAARMVIARVKAAFIGSRLAIARLIAVVLAVGALAVPFAAVKFDLPLFSGGFSAGLVGLIMSFTNGLAMKLPAFLGSPLLGKSTLAAAVPAGCLFVLALLDVAIFAALLLSFLNLTKSANFESDSCVCDEIHRAKNRNGLYIARLRSACRRGDVRGHLVPEQKNAR